MMKNNYKNIAIIITTFSILLSLWSVRLNVSEKNILPLIVLLFLLCAILYGVYKNNIAAMILLGIVITFDTAYQLFVQKYTPGLSLIIWFLIVGNLINAILIKKQNRERKKS